MWSDIPNNRQLRWLEDDGRVTVFRQPSGHSNGNTFDFQGRQISCEHSGRRVVRYEHDGSITVIAPDGSPGYASTEWTAFCAASWNPGSMVVVIRRPPVNSIWYRSSRVAPNAGFERNHCLK